LVNEINKIEKLVIVFQVDLIVKVLKLQSFPDKINVVNF